MHAAWLSLLVFMRGLGSVVEGMGRCELGEGDPGIVARLLCVYDAHYSDRYLRIIQMVFVFV